MSFLGRVPLPIACVIVLAAGAAADGSPDRPQAPPLDIPNARRPLPGLLTGGQPSPEQLELAAAAGYQTVITLRTPEEKEPAGEERIVTDAGLRYVRLPIAGTAGLTEENVRQLDELLGNAEYPVLLHCGSGNRIGAVLALRAAWVQGVGASEALEFGLASGLTSLEPAVRDLLDMPAE